MGRPKHYWSIYQKMIVRGRDFAEIFDLVGIRILVEDVNSCYAAIGVVHSIYQALPGRFKDYISSPRFGVYQSLHTTVIGPDTKPLEVQIRTHEMHHNAEYGIAAHWRYKEGSSAGDAVMDKRIAWMRKLLEQAADAARDGETSPLQGVDNVILTPHIGGSTLEAQERIGEEVARKLLSFLDTGSTGGAVNFPHVDQPRDARAARFLHVHRNVPGVLARVDALVGEHGFVARPKLAEQLVHHLGGVADDRHINRADLAHLCRVDVGVDDFRIGRETLHVTGDAIVEAGADGDEQADRQRPLAFRQQQCALQHAMAGVEVQRLREQGLRMYE